MTKKMRSKEQSRGLPMIGLTLQKSLNAPKTPTAHKMSHKSKKKCQPKCGSFGDCNDDIGEQIKSYSKQHLNC